MFEITFSFIALIIYLIFHHFNKKISSLTLFAVGFLLFVYFDFSIKKISLKSVGLRFDNLNMAFSATISIFILTLVLFLIANIFLSYKCKGRINLRHKIVQKNFFKSLLLYPLWGIVQQFLVLGFFYYYVSSLFGVGWLSFFTTVFFFSTIHFPNIKFMIFTFLGEVLILYFFTLVPNIIILGIYHGIFGTLFYYLFLSDDVIKRF